MAGNMVDSEIMAACSQVDDVDMRHHSNIVVEQAREPMDILVQVL